MNAKTVIIVIMLVSCIVISAQTQNGYIKTLGRPNKTGTPLGNVTIRTRGAHNTVLSNEKGLFSILLPGFSNGDKFAFQQIQKNGYELNDPNVIGRYLAFSDKIPVCIIMVSSKELQKEKLRIENKAYQAAERTYKRKVAQLKKQIEVKTISIEQYRQQVEELKTAFEKYQSMIDELANHYAHIDYDDLDEKEREICLCIENGELVKADSLLQTTDLMGLLKQHQANREEIMANMANGVKLKNEAVEDMRHILKQQEKDAEYLYQLYTIALARFNNKDARFYVETRAELDTMIIQWQVEAGKYFTDYTTDYTKALSYYQRALRRSIELFGEQSNRTAAAYNNLGVLYDTKRDYTRAIEYYTKAIDILENTADSLQSDIATSYNNIGVAYDNLKNYPKALECLEKALAIKQSVNGTSQQTIADTYNNMGAVYVHQGDYLHAQEYYDKAYALK